MEDRFRRSSYSAATSNNCVEVAHLMPDDRFRKSSYTNANSNNCVEVADSPGASAVRDTKHRDLGVLLFRSSEWGAFVDAAKRDSF